MAPGWQPALATATASVEMMTGGVSSMTINSLYLFTVCLFVTC